MPNNDAVVIPLPEPAVPHRITSKVEAHNIPNKIPVTSVVTRKTRSEPETDGGTSLANEPEVTDTAHAYTIVMASKAPVKDASFHVYVNLKYDGSAPRGVYREGFESVVIGSMEDVCRVLDSAFGCWLLGILSSLNGISSCRTTNGRLRDDDGVAISCIQGYGFETHVPNSLYEKRDVTATHTRFLEL